MWLVASYLFPKTNNLLSIIIIMIRLTLISAWLVTVLTIIISAQLYSTSNNNKHNVIIRFIVDFYWTSDMEQK